MKHPQREAPARETAKGEGQLSLVLTMMSMMAGWTGIVLKSVVDRRVNRTREFYDMAAPRYRPAPVTLTRLEYAKKYLRKTDTVLDFGCADGTLSLEIAGRVREVFGIDISPGMIDAAKRKAHRKMVQNTVFFPATIADDRLQEGSFDVILAFNILHAFRDGRDEVQRIHGLLKPGGLFISLTPCMGEGRTFIGSVLSVLVHTGIFPYVRFFRIPELENLVTGGGFHTIVMEKMSSSNQPLLFMVAEKIP